MASLAAPFAFGLAMTRGLSHDEHQHIATGMLRGREGLLPYRDFPLFHTPYLTFIYGAIFRLTEYPLLAAVCASTLVALLGVVAFGTFRPRGECSAWRAAFVVVGLCLAADLFTQGAGRAWNLEPSLLLAVGAFLSVERGLVSGRRGWLVLAGGLLGLPTPATLAAILATDPPSAVLVGFEERGEEPLVDYAKARGFTETALEEEERLWTTP